MNCHRIKKSIPKNGYLKYLKQKHDYTNCNWCNRVIKKTDKFCHRCGTSQEK